MEVNYESLSQTFGLGNDTWVTLTVNFLSCLNDLTIASFMILGSFSIVVVVVVFFSSLSFPWS